MADLLPRRFLLAAPALLLARPAFALEVLTPRATEGPFYPRTLPADQDNDLVKVDSAVRQAGGDMLALSGRVLDRSAKPVAGARVEIWQCDMNGIYLHPGDRNLAKRDAAFQGFGHAMSDGDGKFTFRTIVPVPYTGRTPHIHMKVKQDGRELLTTQFYRAGFAGNASDRVFRALGAAEQKAVSMVLNPTAASFAANISVVV
jgi:protocatechuate 3,4-dioxygenase beta subunit